MEKGRLTGAGDEKGPSDWMSSRGAKFHPAGLGAPSTKKEKKRVEVGKKEERRHTGVMK